MVVGDTQMTVLEPFRAKEQAATVAGPLARNNFRKNQRLQKQVEIFVFQTTKQELSRLHLVCTPQTLVHTPNKQIVGALIKVKSISDRRLMRWRYQPRSAVDPRVST